MAGGGEQAYADIRLQRGIHTVRYSIVSVLLVLTLVACTPTVKIATDEPITINLNVNIKHEILIKVDRELDDLFSDKGDLF